LIKNLQKETLADFSGGRVTSENQATIPPNCLLVGSQRPGSRWRGPADPRIHRRSRPTRRSARCRSTATYEYERQTDRGSLHVRRLHRLGGAAVKPRLSHRSTTTAIPPTFLEDHPRQRRTSTSSRPSTPSTSAMRRTQARSSTTLGNRQASCRGGCRLPRPRSWLRSRPGTLNLTYGTSYVYCEVFQWTDNQGVTRFHIGPPSDFSAHTGPLVQRSKSS
jgi:hypothetical protein